MGVSPFPQCPWVQPPTTLLCGLAFQVGPECYCDHLPTNSLSLLLKEAEALETETKLFEDLEFQQLERESRVEEERELAGQGLLRSKAELLRSVAKRKVGVCGIGLASCLWTGRPGPRVCIAVIASLCSLVDRLMWNLDQERLH